MKGDFSRNSFRPAKHYSGVRQQQGRVQLDADWNEQVDIQTHLARTHHRDVIGLAGVPHSDGNFRIRVGNDPDDFIIEPGRIYVDGILCELEESTIPITEFDPDDNKVIQVAAAKDEPSLQAGEQVRLTAGGVTTAVDCCIATVGNENRVTLDQDVSELSGGGNPTLRRRTTYRHQPDYQVPSDGIATGTYLAYLDVWERHVTAIEDPTIREVALGGPDTATRTKTVWQVKLVNLENSTELESLGLSEHDKWDGNARPDRGMLTARCQAPQSTDQIYSLKSGGGYQGPENQLYRVEIHAGGQLGGGSANRPTFKWSRDNGSVVTRWLAQDKDLLTVESTGLDENLKFAKGQWIELTDDTLDLQGRRGVLFQIKEVAAQTIIIDPATKDDPDGVISEDPAWYDCFGPHPKIRRWDFTAWADMAIPAVDGANGDGWVTLENGIEVKFEPGSYRTGDYWLIAARRSEANIIWPADQNDHPLPQPPAGIEHHYAPLAKLEYTTGEYQLIRDYRRVLRPLTDPQLEYLSGDGQEAKPGDRLPQPLRVGVFSGLQPVPEARVHFEIDGGGGTLLPEPAADAPGQTSLTLSPDAAGEVSCCWTLPEFYGAESEQEERRTGQRVKATLVDEADRPLDDLPVYFTATLSLAEQVAYEPRGRGAGSARQMGRVDTVQKGLDRLDKIKVNTQGQDKMEGPLTIAKTLTIDKGLTVGSDGDKWEGGKPKTTLHGGLKVAGGAEDDYRDLLVEGSAMIKKDLIIKGNIIVKGDTVARDVGHVAGSMLLGNEPNDSIEFFGRLSSAEGQPALLVDDTLHVINDVIVDGNVGIGTASPISDLHVSGQGAGITIDDNNHGGSPFLHFRYADAAGARIRADGDLKFQVDAGGSADTDRMIIKSDGNVGIGTASPGAKLHIRGDQLYVEGTGHAPAIHVRNTTGAVAAVFGDTGGNVGIGTTEPGAKLEVRATTEYVRDGQIILDPGVVASPEGGTDVPNWIRSERLTNTSWDLGLGGTSYGGGQPLVMIKSNGNVGIGTASPSAKLEVAGTVKATAFQGDGSGLTGISAGKWSDGPSEAIYFNTGNVGIGTTGPREKLEVAGAIRGNQAGALRISTGNGYVDVGPQNTTWSHFYTDRNRYYFNRGVTVDSGMIGSYNEDLSLQTQGNTRLTISKSTGAIGIGTTVFSPRMGNLLELRKDVVGARGPMLRFTNKSLGNINSSCGIEFGFENTGNYTNSAEIRVIHDGGTSAGFEFRTAYPGGNAHYARLTIKPNGNVGIGTTNPGSDKLDVRGRCYASGGWHGINSDYAEYFESTRAARTPGGTSVVLTKNGKIRPATINDIPVGIVSDNPAIVGNSYKEWPKKYLIDELGSVIMEEYNEEVMAPKKETVTRERQKMRKLTVEEEVTRVEVVKKGRKYVQEEVSETLSREVEEPVFREVNLYDTTGKKVIGKHKVPVMETYQEEIEVLDDEGNPILEGTGKFVTSKRPKLNPDYDESKEYVPREDRLEWNCVGLLGQLPLRKGQPVAPTWVKIKDISGKVELWLVK